ncbi:hypothetical protein CLV36_102353 [Laceyella sediminis]|uniref:Uncharacterized protein n=1 Tax=Laceyella sediminis TaxID=573074 RepID=A0ABX5EV09_9BACL|nr:hypothetical protein [Laceyella sediminis]PRZ16640.1 hypothetical protein CLV36_102353 [Laceyella sediminis]
MRWKKWSVAALLICIVTLSATPTTVDASSLFKAGPEMPGVKNYGWVPQGLTYLKSKNWLLISNYWDQGKGAEGHPSTIAVVDKASGKYVKNVYLYEGKGKKHYGHVGGIAVTSNYLWVASTTGKHSYLLQYPLSSLISTKSKGNIYPKKVHNLKHATSYVTYHYKYKKNNPTPDKQLCIGQWVPKSKGSHGNLYCHSLDKNENFSAKYTTYQTPTDVQGVEFYGKDVDNSAYVLYSRSFGRKYDSKLDIYKGFGSKAKKVKSVTMHSMSEEIVQVGSQLYVSFESGAKKYRRGGKRQTYHLYYGNIKSLVK